MEMKQEGTEQGGLFHRNEIAPPLPGKTIHGYTLEEQLGRGKLTAVYRARAKDFSRVSVVIITLLLVPETLSEQARERFRKRFFYEAQWLTGLHHPLLLPLYGYGEHEGYFYLISPDVPGETLKARTQRRGRWSLSEIRVLLMQLATAFTYVHSQGRAYGYFQPANVLLLDEAIVRRSDSLQIMGLGLAQMVSMSCLEEQGSRLPFEYLRSVNGAYLGTAEYLAPEIVMGKEGDARSDVYSLGVLLFELLSGRPPFRGESYLDTAQKHINESPPPLCEVAPDQPVALELVINHALYRNPEKRFQTPNELVAAYIHVLKERLQAPGYYQIARIGEQRRTPVPENLRPPELDEVLACGTQAQEAEVDGRMENNSWLLAGPAVASETEEMSRIDVQAVISVKMNLNEEKVQEKQKVPVIETGEHTVIPQQTYMDMVGMAHQLRELRMDFQKRVKGSSDSGLAVEKSANLSSAEERTLIHKE